MAPTPEYYLSLPGAAGITYATDKYLLMIFCAKITTFFLRMTISDEYESLVSAGSLPNSNLISVICKELDRCVAAREHKCEIVINKTSGVQIDDDIFQKLLALLKP